MRSAQTIYPWRKRKSCLQAEMAPTPTAFAIPVSDFFDLNAFLEGAEKELIVRTLTSTRGAQAEAARRMGLSRSALAYKLTKYGIRSAE